MNSLIMAVLIAAIVPTLAMAKSKRQDRIENTFLLKHRETGELQEFYDTNQKQAKKAMIAAGVSSSDVSKCEVGERFPDSEQPKGDASSNSSKDTADNEQLVMQRLELSILLEAFSTRQQSALTDSQLDWVKTLDLCDAKTRNGLRALGLMIQNYQLLRAAEI